MQHIFDAGPRDLLDAFEKDVINAFSAIDNVDGVWTRISQNVGDFERPKNRALWVQLGRRSPTTLREVEQRFRELCTRHMNAGFSVTLDVLVDELPPANIAPVPIWLRNALSPARR